MGRRRFEPGGAFARIAAVEAQHTRPRGRQPDLWASPIERRPMFRALLAAGYARSEIARLYGVSPSAIHRAAERLTR